VLRKRLQYTKYLQQEKYTIITKGGVPDVQQGRSCRKDLIQLKHERLKSFSKELVTTVNSEQNNTWLYGSPWSGDHIPTIFYKHSQCLQSTAVTQCSISQTLHTLCHRGNFVSNAQPQHSKYKHFFFSRNIFSHLCVNHSMTLGFTLHYIIVYLKLYCKFLIMYV
jgi:hypothetical protein